MPLSDDERRLLEAQHEQTVDWLKKLDDRLDASRQVAAAMNAKLDAAIDRMRAESNALFEARSNHAERISSIERDYVQEEELRRVEGQHARQITALADKFDALSGRVSKYVGGVAVLVVLVQVFGPTILKTFGIGN